MFGPLGGPELLLIFVIALIVFGPRKLPEIGKSLGKMLGEFRRASNDLKHTIEDEVEADRLRQASSEPYGQAGGTSTGPSGPAPESPPASSPATAEPPSLPTSEPASPAEWQATRLCRNTT